MTDLVQLSRGRGRLSQPSMMGRINDFMKMESQVYTEVKDDGRHSMDRRPLRML